MVKKKILVAAVIIVLIASVAGYTVWLSFSPIDPVYIAEPNTTWVEEKGVRLSLNHSGQTVHIGEILNYTFELRNVDSPLQLFLYQSAGYSWHEIHNASGTVIELGTGRYAWGPPGPPKEQFFKGQTWTLNSYWDTGRNYWSDVHPAEMSPGNYTLVVKVKYGILDQESETIEISVPIELIES